MFDTQMVFQSSFFFNKYALKMLSRPQNIRVGRVDNLQIFFGLICLLKRQGFLITGYYHEINF